MTGHRGSRTTADEQTRQLEALRLRLAGHTFPEIAEELRYRDKSAAWKAVHRCLDRQEAEGVEHLRRLESARLDVLQRRLSIELDEIAAGSDPDGVVRIVQTLIRLSERRSRLMGLDSPVRAEVAVPNVEAAEAMERLKAKFSRLFADSEELRQIKARLAKLPASEQPSPPGIALGSPSRFLA